MNFFDIGLIAIVLLSIIIMGVYYIKSKHTIRNLFIGSVSGVATLFIAKYALSQFAVVVSVNIFTIIISLILGVPGALSTVLLNAFFKVA